MQSDQTTQLFKGQVSRSQPKDLETDLDKGVSIVAATLGLMHPAVATALVDAPLLGELAATMVKLSESKDMTRAIGQVQPSQPLRDVDGNWAKDCKSKCAASVFLNR